MRIDGNEALRRLQSSRNLANLAGVRNTSVPTPEPEPVEPQVPAVNSPAANPSLVKSSTTNPYLPQHNNVTHEVIQRGRQAGSRSVPEPIRDIMAQQVLSGTKAINVARAFGVSPDVAERAASGRVGGRPATLDRLQALKEKKLDIKDKALFKLMQSLDLLDEEKLADCSGKELATVAGQLAKVASMGDDDNHGVSATQILVYAPQLRDESKFKTVDI